MRIVQLIPGVDTIGGAERQVLALSAGLARRGMRVTVIALSGSGGTAARELADAGVEFVTLRMRKGLADPRGWLQIRRWLHSNSPDIVHAHLPHAVWMARLIRLLAPVRAVVDTIHTAATGPASRSLLYRTTSRLSDCVTAVSRGVADAYNAAGVISNRDLTILSNGIDTDVWHPDALAGSQLRAAQRIGDNFLWLAVGRLDPVKGYPTLLQAFAQLPQSAQLVIAGVGPLQAKLRRLSQTLAIEQRVRFLGNEPNVMPWMQAADGFVLASRWEGLPMTLLEAGACGLPCVATSVAGSEEIVVDGESGFLARPDDAGSLRRAMLRLMETAPANRLAFGMNARQRIVDSFALESVLGRWLDLYSALLHCRPLPTRWSRRISPAHFVGMTAQ